MSHNFRYFEVTALCDIDIKKILKFELNVKTKVL